MYRLPTSWWCVYHTVCNTYACNMHACVLGLCMWLRWLGNIVGRQFLFWAAWNMWTSATDSSPQPKKALDGAPSCFFPLCFLHTLQREQTSMLSPTHGLTFVSDWSTPKGMADRNHCNLLCLFNCSLSQAQCSRISAMNNENDEMHVLFFPALWMLALSLFAGWWFQRRRHLHPPIDNLRNDALRDPSPTQWDAVRFSVCWLQNWVGRGDL